jgi:mono/diheme cytochrome c family protein
MRFASPLTQSASSRKTGWIRTASEMKNPGLKPSRVLAFTLGMLFCVSLAFGEAGHGLAFDIPYEFTFGSKVLPAGAYTFYEDGSMLAVKPPSGGGMFRQMIISRLGGPVEFLQDGALVFDKANGKHVLSEVWMPWTDGLLIHNNPKGHSREVLLASALKQKEAVSGRAAYNLTCRRCHGPDGNGNEKADKFFNVTIPRLSSSVVQGKSDAELKELITQGTGNMPPVEIDEAGFRHRLPPQDVDAVISYVRTLKHN